MGAGCAGTKNQASFDQRAQIRHSNGIKTSRRDLAIAVVQLCWMPWLKQVYLYLTGVCTLYRVTNKAIVRRIHALL